ncbi:unnamed protein product, partial [Prorocentrum cordatum]
RARCRAAARACPTCCGARRGCPPPARSLGVADRPRGPARQRLRRGAAGRAVPGDAGLRAGRPGCAGLPDLLPAGQESRSVSVLLGFLLLERGVGVDEGLDLVRSSRPQAAPNSLGGRPGGHPRRSWPLKLGFPSGVRVDGVEGSL